MKLWLKVNKIVSANNLVCQDEQCPCGSVYVPKFYVVFPFDTVGEPGPSLINSLGNPDWNAVSDSEFDIETKTWVMPPLFECIEGQEQNTVYYFGYDDYFYQTSGELFFETGAKTAAKIHPTPPKLEYFVIMNYGQQISDDGDIIQFYMTNMPATAAIYEGGIGVQSGFVYEYDVYNFTQGNTLIGSYKVKITFPSKEWEKHLILEPYTHAIADVVDYPSYPLNDAPRLVNAPITVYDSDDNIIGKDSLWIHILPVSVTGCIPDFDYCVIGSCTYSNNDCNGCLVNTRLMVTQESTAGKLAGDCRRRSSLSYGMMSRSYKILACGFDTQSEARDYIEENHSTLYEQMKSLCAGNPWYITGTCECSDETCAQCVAADGSITIRCSDDSKACFEKGGKHYKHTVLADGRGFLTVTEATEYLNSNSENIHDEHRQLCPECANGKFYGMHIYPYWHDGIDGGSCYYGFPYTDVWDCGTIMYYRNNPLEFEMMYGEGASWEIATGPFDTLGDAWIALKKFRINITRWSQWECKGDSRPEYFCLLFFKTPGYRGGSRCLGGTVWCRGGYQYSCAAVGSRKFVSAVEDSSCKRC
jgi:hypothetical protein